jgi:DNA-binding HxlR family transcriptional regulator
MAEAGKNGNSRRSGCPLSSTLEVVGDKWSLIIIRDMLFFGKSTYNEFLSSPEKIATNILNDRLLKLSDAGFISFSGTPKRKRYSLTDMGFDLKPVLEAMALFGMKYFEGSKEYLEERMKHFQQKS